MAEHGNPKTAVSAEEILQTELIVNQALIDILIAKQVITEEELVKSIKNIKRDHQKLLKESSKIVTLKR